MASFIKAAMLSVALVGAILGSNKVADASSGYYHKGHHYQHRKWVKDHEGLRGYWSYY